MKIDTYARKLAELLGGELTNLVPTISNKSGKATLNLPVGITEDEIQTFRAAQGLRYFLQAPELFTPKVCPHCNEGFLVSRMYVAFCSYTCILKSLEEQGIAWSRKDEYELLTKDVYEGNEPIWIKNLDVIHTMIETLNLPIISIGTPDSPTSQE